MRSHSRLTCFAILALFSFVAGERHAAAQDPEQYVRDHYQGKTLVLRGFHSAHDLHYDSSGSPDRAATGDWTEDGFVLVREVRVTGDRIKIKAERLVAESSQKQFQLRPSQEGPGRGRKPVILKIEADFPQHNPSPDQIEALLSKIFLTSHDHIADLVPAYWKPCVTRGVIGDYKNCIFSAEILAVPGVAGSGQEESAGSAENPGMARSESQVFRVGKGVLPPKVEFLRDPEFSDSARLAKFEGVVTLSLVVNTDGVPTNIHIMNPLGYGLDWKAVEAVRNWKFLPALKDGVPVPTQIAVEVNFHLY